MRVALARINQIQVMKNPEITNTNTAILQLGAILLSLWIVSIYNYLLFHTLIEIITVIASLGIFILTWNSRRFLNNHYYLLIGISFFAIGLIDLMHVLSYKGIDVLEAGRSSNVATQLWVAGRYLTALSFLAATFFVGRKLNHQRTMAIYFVVFIFTMLAIFYWKIFPLAYIEGKGLTDFKIISEYIIIALFLVGLILLYRKKDKFDGRAFYLLVWVIVFMIISEFVFTLYVGVYDFFNMFGHLLRFTAFFIAYLAIIELGLMKPYRVIFKELKDSEKSLEYEKNKLAIILDALGDGVCMTNSNYEIEYRNPALIEDFGPLSKSKCYQYLHNRKSPCPWCKNEEIFKGKTFRWEWEYPKSGKMYSLISCLIKTDKGVKLKLDIFHDITERKKLEKSKNEFISLASHQIKTPLASMSLSSELLLRGTLGEISDEQREYLGEIQKSTKRMSALANNLLDVSRIEMGTFFMNPEPLDIFAVISEIFGDFKTLAEDKKIKFEKNIENQACISYFDGHALRTMVENIISNAIRYTPREGKVLVEAKIDNARILIRVSDSGCGIPENQKEEIFTKSFRADNAKEISSDGVGIGLYMSKLIAEKTGSKLWFSSELGKGSDFYLSMPIEAKKE
jgi:signal transduction histidine kinase